MNQNPYASPQAAPPPFTGGGAPPGAAAPWDIGEVLSLAFEGFKRSWGVLVGAIFVQGLIAEIPGQVPTVVITSGAVDKGTTAALVVQIVFALVGFAVSSFFLPGMIKMVLAVARGGAANFGDLFSGGNRMVNIMATQFLYVLAVMIGMVFLILPGIVVSLGLSLSNYYVTDADMGPIDALQASWAATKGHKGKLFVLFLLQAVLMLAGLVFCCVGIFASLAVCQLATAIVFIRLSGRGTATPFFTAAGAP